MRRKLVAAGVLALAVIAAVFARPQPDAQRHGFISAGGGFVPPTSLQNIAVSFSQITNTGLEYLTGIQVDNTAGGTVDDFVLNANARRLIYTGVGARTYDGFKCSSAAHCALADERRTLRVENATSSPVTLAYQALTSTPGDRIRQHDSKDQNIPAHGLCDATYYGTGTAWRFGFCGPMSCVAGSAPVSDGTNYTCTPIVGSSLGSIYLRAASWYVVSGGNSTGTGLMGQNSLRCYRQSIPKAGTISGLEAEITTAGEAGSKIRLDIYGDDGTEQPGALLYDSGQLAGDPGSVPNLPTASPSLAVTPGTYWFCSVAQACATTCPTVRTTANIAVAVDFGTSAPATNAQSFGYAQASVTSTPPNPFVRSGTAASMTRIYFKVQ